MTQAPRPAAREDLTALVGMMGEFYAEAGTTFDAERVTRAFAEILEDERLGCVWILEQDGLPVGYAVLTLSYSLEFGGRIAFLDDLFVRAPHRGRGLGTAAVEAVIAACRARGVRALHLEVALDNIAAASLYRKLGFADRGFQLMTMRL